MTVTLKCGQKQRESCAWYTSIKSFSFLCWTLRIVGQKVSTKSLMAALWDCFPSSSCLLLREYWNLVPNNNNIPVKETCHSRLGAHFLSHNAQRPTKETEILDACIGKNDTPVLKRKVSFLYIQNDGDTRKLTECVLMRSENHQTSFLLWLI